MLYVLGNHVSVGFAMYLFTVLVMCHSLVLRDLNITLINPTNSLTFFIPIFHDMVAGN